MKPGFFFALAIILLAPLSARAQGASTFDTTAYRAFVSAHQNMTGTDLESLHSAGRFLSSAPVQTGAVRYLDTIQARYQLTTDELSLLGRNGFVVSERLTNSTMGAAFSDIYYYDLPVFISTDAILQAIHKSYDAILMDVETTGLISRVDALLALLHGQVPSLVQKYGANAAMQPMLQDLDLYLTVPRILLGDNITPVFSNNASTVSQILSQIQAEQPDSCTIFGATRTIDFSQFTPRGHYTASKLLTQYFQAMIWLGRTEIYLMPPESALPPPNFAEMQRQATDALLLDEAAQAANAYPVLSSIDGILRYFVGDQDNVTLPAIHSLVSSLSYTDATALLDSLRYVSFCNTLSQQAYAFQRINSQILMSDPTSPDQIRPASALLLLGQRFVIDSYVTANVVYDRILYEGVKQKRMLPSTLDILFALGNDGAAQLLQGDLETFHYGSNLADLRYLADSYDAGFWQGTFYNSWLEAIRTLNPPGDRTSLPIFMQTASWWQEKINTQLASWAQLRHDNLLYAKQSYSAAIPTCSYPMGYVEPFPSFFLALRTLADSSVAKFSSPLFQGIGQAPYITYFFSQVRNTMDTLAAIARDELSLTPLSSAEQAFLVRTLSIISDGGCGGPPIYNGWYPQLFYLRNMMDPKGEWVIADVHTAPTDSLGDLVGWVLHGGTGPLNLAVLIAEPPGSAPVAYIGPVLSYYEVTTTNFKRLTDEEWTQECISAPQARPPFSNIYMTDKAGVAKGPGPSLLTGMSPTPPPGAQPAEIALAQNYPNPFNPSTMISFRVSKMMHVHLAVFDILGREVESLINGMLPAGSYSVRFGGSQLSSGVYFYRLEAGGSSLVRKMALVK
ncbi:MAG TPA: DUF3160 domain-containing protein [Bacteroidota bacterium]|nr:DUF3160 domain-containing protein [Bacteroidota bacterium]